MDTIHFQTPSLVDVAYKALKKDITERVLPPGEKIIIRELLERYGISETPIKQALNRMISEGLVETIPRKGMKVRDVKWEEIEELLDIRLMIETYYLKQVVANFKNDTDIQAKIAANLAEHTHIIETAVDLNDYFRNYYLDQEFHQLFIKCSGNKKIAQIYNNLGTHDYAHYIYQRQSREETLAGVREHEAIYRALTAGDETDLHNCIVTHIVNAKNKINRHLNRA